MHPVRVISLKRTPERKRSFEGRNPHLEFEYFEAVDGAAFTKDALDATGLFDPGLKHYSPGAYGGAMSQIRLWQEVVRAGHAMTVVEDDAIFRRDFGAEHERVLGELPPDWDFILWGWNFDALLSIWAMPETSPVVMLFHQDQMRESVEAFQAATHRCVAYRLDKAFGIPAYSISPRGANTFLERLVPLSTFAMYFPPPLGREIPHGALDGAMNAVYSDTKSYVCFPPLVVSKNLRGESTIQTG